MTVRTRLRKGDNLFGTGCILHSNTGRAHPIVTLRFGNNVEHVALGDHHQPLPRIGFGSDSACFASSDARRLG